MIMSIDQSLSCSGVLIWDKGKVLHAVTIKTPSTSTTVDRISKVTNELLLLVCKYKVSHVVIESLPYGINSTSVRPLAGLYYCIEKMCLDNDLKFTEANVTAVKKFATGSGKAKKADMIKAFEAAAPTTFTKVVEAGAKKTTGLADLADAYWIGAYYRDHTTQKD